nr:MAG TPA: hypothetical protein [Bacteriophage sp.]
MKLGLLVLCHTVRVSAGLHPSCPGNIYGVLKSFTCLRRDTNNFPLALEANLGETFYKSLIIPPSCFLSVLIGSHLFIINVSKF